MPRNRGFTLVEVLLVIVILGILGSIVIPRITYSKTTAQKEACNATVAALNSQIELYYTLEGSWPSALTDLENSSTGVSYIDAVPTCAYNASEEYALNATTHRVPKHSH